MRFTKATLASLILSASQVQGFTSASNGASRSTTTPTSLFLEPDALTDYMAKAHEDKLKAIKDIENKKDSEIEDLKREIKQLKSAPGALATTPANPSVADLSKEEIANKLLQYQQFMAKYIVDAQEQKTKAVKAAEMAVSRKYEEKLNLLSGSAAAAPPPQSESTKEAKLFDERTAKISAAAKAGKSRWGDMETAKAVRAASGTSVVDTSRNGVQLNGSAAPPSTLPSVGDTSLFDQRNAMIAKAGKADKSRWGEMEVAKATELSSNALPSSAVVATPEIVEADHGLRNDGGVGGPSLAERVNLGAQLLGSVAATPVSSGPSLYDQRNALVAAAGKAGKSRWGSMEVEHASKLATALPSSSSAAAPVAPVPVSTEVQEADHGLRADGGVSGPSLAQRVNLGAALLGQ